MRIRSASILLVLIATLAAFSQTQEISVAHTKHTIKSIALAEDREILVRVPPSYANGERFPVLYMMDGHAPNTVMMPGILDNQAWGGVIPEMILVSIPNKVRTMDLTPTAIERYPSGGGDKFLDFIQKEVMPMVEKNYRTQSYRVIAGHSLSGMFAVYSFLVRPEMFNGYIAASPALYYDKDLPIKRAEKVFKQNKDWNKVMYIGVGNEPIYTPSFNQFKTVLDNAKPRGFVYEFKEYKDENHSSAVLPIYTAGLRKIFAGWEYPQDYSLPTQEQHFKKLSARFGYEIKIPENLLNMIGYELMQEKRLAEAIAAFKKTVELYPNSANAYDSLAEAQEKKGDVKAARENFEKAYKLAESQGNKELAKNARENFDRLNAKN